MFNQTFFLLSNEIEKAMKRGDDLQSKKSSSKGIKMIKITIPSTLTIDKEIYELYLALDMGGSNFRVSIIEIYITNDKDSIEKKKAGILEEHKYKIPNEHKNETIFIWAASRIKDSLGQFNPQNVKKLKQVDRKICVGFTFSFPIESKSIEEGVLLQWNKEFNAPSLVGQNVTNLLERECQSIGLAVKIGAVLNDAISTLLAGIFLHGEVCKLAVILGSGTNAALIHPESSTSAKYLTVVNCEWAAYGENENDYLPLEEVDKKYDKEHETGKQYFEKMTSGLYLPRLYELSLGKESKPAEFSAKELSQLEAAGDELAKKLSDRSVYLVSSAIMGALQFIKVEKETLVVIDGSLYEKYYNYKERLETSLPDNIKLCLGKDYSCIGSVIPLLQ